LNKEVRFANFHDHATVAIGLHSVNSMCEAPRQAVACRVVVREVGVIEIFSDWPGTVTYYANCMKH
jgi:hypothetical protein